MDRPIDLAKFRPAWAVALLANDPEEEKRAFLQPWALAQLLGWAILDQRPGKRGVNPKIRTVNAKQAGQVALAYLLDRHVKRVQAGSATDHQTLLDMLGLYLRLGGFAASLQGRGAKSLVSSAKGANNDLRYVYKVVDYMCRYKQYGGDKLNCNIESAKSFIELSEGNGYSRRNISTCWEKYKKAAPYIFASYQLFSRGLQKTITPDEVMDWLEKFTSKQKRLTRFVGRAAYAADILTGHARKVRQRDFEGFDRIAPPMRSFTKEELAIIGGIDPAAFTWARVSSREL
jgi:hypothetical protein